MLLEVERKVKKRPLHDSFLAQQERDQEPSESAVPVEKRMDRFKLGMGDSDFHQDGHRIRVVQEFLEVVQRGVHLLRRGWNECR